MVCGETTDFCNIAKNLEGVVDKSFVSQIRGRDDPKNHLIPGCFKR